MKKLFTRKAILLVSALVLISAIIVFVPESQPVDYHSALISDAVDEAPPFTAEDDAPSSFVFGTIKWDSPSINEVAGTYGSSLIFVEDSPVPTSSGQELGDEDGDASSYAEDPPDITLPEVDPALPEDDPVPPEGDPESPQDGTVTGAGASNPLNEPPLSVYNGQRVGSVSVPSVGLADPLAVGTSLEGAQHVLESSAALIHYGYMGLPTDALVSVIGGHNYMEFNKLKDAKIGDEVVLYLEWGTFVYEIYDIQYHQTLGSAPRGNLVVYTCYPYDEWENPTKNAYFFCRLKDYGYQEAG